MSGIVADSNGDELSSLRPRLSDMPESCVALVLMHLDPPEICKLARLNRAFRGASSADFIWESKLPSNYQFIVDKVFGGSSKTNMVDYSSKKHLYARLCSPSPFDGGNKVCLFPFIFFVFRHYKKSVIGFPYRNVLMHPSNHNRLILDNLQTWLLFLIIIHLGQIMTSFLRNLGNFIFFIHNL